MQSLSRQASGSKGAVAILPPADTVHGDSHGTAALTVWGSVRCVASVYLFLWAGAISASLQVLAPGFEASGARWVTASSLAVDALSSAHLRNTAHVALVFFGFVVPLLLLGALRGRASLVLDTEHHASVTLAILTTGYRLQLTGSEAEQLVRVQLQTAKGDKGGAVASSSDNTQILRMAREVSRRMEARCCGLAKYVPSHGFALVRQIQTVLVLCALWLMLQPGSRAAVVLLTLVASALLTYSLQPYALPELNSLDITANLVVGLHALAAYLDAWAALQWVVWPLHAATALLLVVCIMRGASRKARTALVSANAWLRSKLPALEQGAGGGEGDAEAADGDEGLASSALPGVLDIAWALGVRCGVCRMPSRRRPAAAAASFGQWGGFAAAASSALDAARDGNAGGLSTLLANMTGGAVQGGTDGKDDVDGGDWAGRITPRARRSSLSLFRPAPRDSFVVSVHREAQRGAHGIGPGGIGGAGGGSSILLQRLRARPGGAGALPALEAPAALPAEERKRRAASFSAFVVGRLPSGNRGPRGGSGRKRGGAAGRNRSRGRSDALLSQQSQLQRVAAGGGRGGRRQSQLQRVAAGGGRGGRRQSAVRGGTVHKPAGQRPTSGGANADIPTAGVTGNTPGGGSSA